MTDRNNAATPAAAAPDSQRPVQRDPDGPLAWARRAPEMTDDAPLTRTRMRAEQQLQATK